MKEKLTYNGKCDNEECSTVFKEKNIVYFCEECCKYYCFSCFCQNHFKKHETKWQEYEINNGKPTTPRGPSGSLKL